MGNPVGERTLPKPPDPALVMAHYIAEQELKDARNVLEQARADKASVNQHQMVDAMSMSPEVIALRQHQLEYAEQHAQNIVDMKIAQLEFAYRQMMNSTK